MEDIEKRLLEVRVQAGELELERLRRPAIPEKERLHWTNPLLLAILGALGTAIIAIINNSWQFHSNQEMERTKRETSLIFKALESTQRPDQMTNLQFFVNAGLLLDPDGKISRLKPEDLPRLERITQIGPFSVVEAPEKAPAELEALRQQPSHRIDSPPTMDQAPLELPPFDRESEVWLVASCVADCFDDRSFVGVTILYNGNTVVQRESPQGRGVVTAAAFVKIRVPAGHRLQFVVDGADFLAKRKAVTFTAYSLSLP